MRAEILTRLAGGKPARVDTLATRSGVYSALAGLERDGLLTRTVHATVPPRVDYELTALGRSLLTTIRPLTLWATTHITDVLAAREAYDRYEVHVVYQQLVNYCTVALSGVYLDGIKVRLYTQPAGAVRRRAAQTVLHAVLESLVRLLAPILPFTADEVWAAMPGGPPSPSVHLEEFPAPVPARRDDRLEADWAILLRAREAVTRKLEALRERKEIGSSLAAEVEIAALAGCPVST